jgi:hypothetical protein
MDALAALLGHPLEMNLPPKHISPTLRHGTSGWAAGAAGTTTTTTSSSSSSSGGGGQGQKLGSAVFHVHYDQQPFLMFVELGQRFPEELPVVTLQSIRWVMFKFHETYQITRLLVTSSHWGTGGGSAANKEKVERQSQWRTCSSVKFVECWFYVETA